MIIMKKPQPDTGNNFWELLMNNNCLNMTCHFLGVRNLTVETSKYKESYALR